jgi:type I restriction enzyme S subunit
MYEIKYRDESKMRPINTDFCSISPLEWKETSLRWQLNCKSGDSISTNQFVKSESKESLYPVIGGNGVAGYTSKYNIKKNTIAIGRVGALCGNVHYINYRCWITDNSLFINNISKNIELEYLKIVLEKLNLNQYSNSTAQPLITGETIKKRKIVFPKHQEQQKIANFLDIKTAQFDSIISKKEQLIQKLEEAKKSLISEVVTGKVKIIDGELVERDPSEMKDSGVEWLGMVPENWDKIKIKYKTNITMGQSPDSNYVNQDELGLPFYQGKAEFGEVNPIPNNYCTKPAKIAKVESLLISVRAPVGEINLANEECCIGRGLAAINNKSNKLIKYQLSHSKDALQSIATGTTFKAISIQQLTNLYITDVDNEEQQNNTKFLDVKTVQFQNIIKKNKQQIEKLKKAKQSLISEVVTGKIDLRDWEIIEEGEV